MSRAALLLVSVSLLLAGCQILRPSHTVDHLGPLQDAPSFVYSVGDVLELKFFYNPELNDVQTVRRDGRIMLQLVGLVDIAGKSPEQLKMELETRYSPILKHPDITIIARNLPGERVFVGGEVVAPGPVDMQGPISVLDAVLFAGGFKSSSAEVDSVLVIRHRDGQRIGFLVDLEKALRGEAGQEIMLQPQDIVYVPRTQIVQVNEWIDQHFYDLLPNMGLNYSYTDIFEHGSKFPDTTN
ncbi:MAG: polysaccharide biosynthesis/export family protein [Candidatus Hydrogenedentes bacterium]|nr:polysaccharide biosynthesis/export family protein [Candidatus Hydrogenedentota bacterium]